MSLPFTNTHMHVFNTTCAPDRFLIIVPSKLLRSKPVLVKNIIDTKPGRWVITSLFKVFNLNDKISQKKFARYLAFLDVGTDATQQEIFETAFQVGKQYDPSARFVGLTMNMDYMDSQPSRHMITYETQLEQVKALKRFYPTNFFPFLGIDPRHKSGTDLVNWAKPYFESGVETDCGQVYPYFSGIKLYPALGFFPFDPRLEELYAYAEENDIPVMTHCTRSGSQYIGNRIESLIPKYPAAIVPQSIRPPYTNWQKEINDRIDRYYSGPGGKGSWIKNSDHGENDLACDLFGHPQNYIPLFEKFPNLKICLAHMGGSDEIKPPTPGSQLEMIQSAKADGWNWFEKIREMMLAYPNMYTDISYTLSDLTDSTVLGAIQGFVKNPCLSERILFGTDFFLTEQEKSEADLYKSSQDAKTLGPWIDQIARTNPQRYLMQPLLNPIKRSVAT